MAISKVQTIRETEVRYAVQIALQTMHIPNLRLRVKALKDVTKGHLVAARIIEGKCLSLGCIEELFVDFDQVLDTLAVLLADGDAKLGSSYEVANLAYLAHISISSIFNPNVKRALANLTYEDEAIFETFAYLVLPEITAALVNDVDGRESVVNYLKETFSLPLTVND